MSVAQIVHALLDASIVLTVFAFGLGLRRSDALYLLRRPGRLGGSILAMYVLAPFIALVFALAVDVPLPVKVALVTLALSPVSPLLPARESRTGARGAYAVSLFACSALLAVLTLPISVELLGLSRSDPLRAPATLVARTVLGTVLLPLAGGVAVRALFPDVARRIAHPLSRTAALFLVVGAVPLLAGAWPVARSLAGNGTALVLGTFAAAALAIGHLLGGNRAEDRIVLALCTSMRHPAVAISVAAAIAPAQRTATAAVLLYLLMAGALGNAYVRRVARPAALPAQPAIPRRVERLQMRGVELQARRRNNGTY